MIRPFLDAIVADWQFERGLALARGDRWGARLATARAALAVARVVVRCAVPALHALLATDAAWRIGRATTAAVAIVTALFYTAPVAAVFTGAYPSMPITVGNVLRLLVFVLPTLVGVAIPTGVAIGILLACGGRSQPHRVRALVAVFAVIATLAVCACIGVATFADRPYRDLTSPPGIEQRINPPGSVGYRFERTSSWSTLCASVVLAAFAFTAASASRGRPWLRGAAGAASLLYPFSYLLFGMLAFQRIVPVVVAAWMPNVLFVTAAVVLVRLKPDTT